MGGSGCWLHKNNIPLQALCENTKRHLSCSENVAYDIAGSTVKKLTQANVPCTENVAYATVNKAEDNVQNKCIVPKHAAVYEVVQM